MSVKVEAITEPVALGEAPHWDDRQQALFYVSINDRTLNKYIPATKEYTQTPLAEPPGFMVPVDGTTDQFVVGMENKLVIIQWGGKYGSAARVVKEIAEVDRGMSGMKLNDGKADPRGRIYSGTLHIEDAQTNLDGQGSLYCLDRGTVTKVDDKIRLANGLAWDLKENAFYYIDSMEHDIRSYDYDVETGAIWNMKYVFDFKKANLKGTPDGMTIDSNGNLWVALFGGSAIVNINPLTRKLIQTIPIPANLVNSVTFGGPEFDTLFVTTGCLYTGQREPSLSGATFKITGTGVTGLPNMNYKV